MRCTFDESSTPTASMSIRAKLIPYLARTGPKMPGTMLPNRRIPHHTGFSYPSDASPVNTCLVHWMGRTRLRHLYRVNITFVVPLTELFPSQRVRNHSFPRKLRISAAD
jgi:hypothetical protein